MPEDEPGIGRAAVGGQRRRAAGNGLHRPAHGLDQRARLGQKHIADAEEAQRKLRADFLGRALALRPHPRLDAGARVQVVVADVEVGQRRAGDHVGGGVGHRHDGRLHARRLEARRTRIHRRRRHAVDDAGQLGQGIVGEMRIGRMPLLAVHDHLGIEIAAPADLDLVAHHLGACRLAHETAVHHLAPGFHPLQHLDGAVDAGALLVAGDEEGDRAALEPAGLDVIERGGDEAGDAALHVGRAPAIKNAVGNLRVERRMRPPAFLADRHDIGVPREAQMRRARTQARIEILHIRRAGFRHRQPVAGEARRLQHALEQRQRAAFDRRDAAAADQRLGKLDGIAVICGHGSFR